MKYRLAGALAVALAISVASAAEAEWPENPASEVATFATVLRFQIYADHCSAGLPALGAKFDSLMKSLRDRIRRISTSVLASDEYHGMKDKLVPVEVIDALKHSFHDVEHNVGRLDVASACPQALRDFGALDDEALKLTFTSNLTAVHNMSQKLEAARTR
ncbi:MAG TPA: hypothetical protein VNQ32_07715 [Steroidobacteraceae bacterium]|nr:hypothetical protein [Steroidobacteraceae bacterium]